jgi:SpoVK/Ycf46/Vps4 family AAA+-type ATPase
MLEYFEGILFLTTNRKDQFDDAFMSRINVKIRLPDLDQEARTHIWQAMVEHNKAAVNSGSWSDAAFEALGKLSVNV